MTRACTGTRLGRKAMAALLVIVLALPSRPAHAQCEPFFVTTAAMIAAIAAHQILVNSFLAPPSGILPTLMEESTTQFQDILLSDESLDINLNPASFVTDVIPGVVRPLLDAADLGFVMDGLDIGGLDLNIGGLGFVENTMRRRLDKFSADLLGALGDMSKQIYAADINNARMISSMVDSSNMSASALRHQMDEIDARIQHNPPVESCQFDTVASAMGRAHGVSRAVDVASVRHIGTRGHAENNTPAAASPLSETGARFADHVTTLCDADSNSGAAPCEASGTLPNAAILPGKTIFAQDTLNMEDADTRLALQELTQNIIGFESPIIIPAKVLNTPRGRDLLRNNREYTTQMDAIAGLVTGVISERAPGAGGGDAASATAAEQVQQIRLKAGANNPSPTPSQKEIRQALVEQLQNPNYYVGLGDGGSSTVGQKEIFLRAYNAAMLYELIDKQEKISNAYAIETANMLQKYRGDKEDQMREFPLRVNR